MSKSDSHVMKADQKRRFGFKETREEREKRLSAEKQLKWHERLAKEDLAKLEKELDSLHRASFLAPQQKERLRLVERMVSDLRALRATNSHQNDNAATPTVVEAEKTPVISDSDEDSLLGENGDEGGSGGRVDATVFVPRTLRRVKRSATRTEKDGSDINAARAESELLAGNTNSTKEIDSFLESLM